MDDEGDDDPVPLPNVNAAILKKVQIMALVRSAFTCNDSCAAVCLQTSVLLLLLLQQPNHTVKLANLLFQLHFPVEVMLLSTFILCGVVGFVFLSCQSYFITGTTGLCKNVKYKVVKKHTNGSAGVS